MVLELSSRIEGMRLELTRAAETAVKREADLQALTNDVAQLQVELDHSKADLSALASSQPKEARPSGLQPEAFPVGLTTNGKR